MIDLLRGAGAIGVRRLVVGEEDDSAAALPPGIVRIGVHRDGPLPERGLDTYDLLVTGITETTAPSPWVALDTDELDRLEAGIAAQPVAAALLVQVLRMTLALDFPQALLVESMAYSTLLASAPFRAWRAAHPPQPSRDDVGPRVLIEPEGDGIAIILSRPRGRNAVDAAMRDALCEALETAALLAGPVTLRGDGGAFSIGGDLAEFGTAADPGEAHAIRTLRSPARLLHVLGGRATAYLHGPCIGAGIEIPAAAARIVAHPRARFRLPELAMGLIPGAGGTATIPRRIGRHRACWFMLSGAELDAETALAWGLVDRIASRPKANPVRPE